MSTTVLWSRFATQRKSNKLSTWTILRNKDDAVWRRQSRRTFAIGYTAQPLDYHQNGKYLRSPQTSASGVDNVSYHSRSRCLHMCRCCMIYLLTIRMEWCSLHFDQHMCPESSVAVRFGWQPSHVGLLGLSTPLGDQRVAYKPTNRVKDYRRHPVEVILVPPCTYAVGSILDYRTLEKATSLLQSH